MPPKANGQGGSWSVEDKLDLVTRLLFHNNRNPKYKDAPLPPGRTVYAVDHLLRRLKLDWTKKMEEMGEGVDNVNCDEDEVATPKIKRVRSKSNTATATPKSAKKQVDSVAESDDENKEPDTKKIKKEEEVEPVSELQVQ